MPNKHKKINNPTVSPIKKGSKVFKSMGKSLNDKKDLRDKIEKIENFVSNELHKFDEENLDANNILYLRSDQLISENSENDLEKNQLNLNELKKIIREIVIEEIEKNSKINICRIIIMEKTFKHTEVEARLLKKWEETNSFRAGVHSKKSSSFPFQ